MIVSGTFGCPGEDVYTIEAVLYVERERERERPPSALFLQTVVYVLTIRL